MAAMAAGLHPNDVNAGKTHEAFLKSLVAYIGGNKGGESGVLWKGLLAWAVVSVICFAIFGADAAGKYHICESSEAAAAKPAGGAPPAGDGAVEEQPGIELAATSEA